MVGDLTLRFRLLRADYRRLLRLTQHRGEKLRLLRRKGIYWAARRLLKRPVLLLGMLFLLALVLVLPTRILFIEVEGNGSIPARQILEAAESCGIQFGVSRREVRSERMKNALLAAIPELQWAGINTSGCTAVISVRERTTPEEQTKKNCVSSIVAARDGVITEMTVLQGNGICKVGQAVKAGQVLVSGYTDCGICIRATQAQAEVYAETRRDLTAVMPSEYTQRGQITRSEKKYSLIIGKKRINFDKGSGISDTSCVKMYKEMYVTLPGGFRLPVVLVTEEWIWYDETAAAVEQGTAAAVLTESAGHYLTGLMVAGTVNQRSESVVADDGCYRLYGAYACTEMICKTRIEESLENYGKAD